jgi:hypothetical protein
MQSYSPSYYDQNMAIEYDYDNNNHHNLEKDYDRVCDEFSKYKQHVRNVVKTMLNMLIYEQNNDDDEPIDRRSMYKCINGLVDFLDGKSSSYITVPSSAGIKITTAPMGTRPSISKEMTSSEYKCEKRKLEYKRKTDIDALMNIFNRSISINTKDIRKNKSYVATPSPSSKSSDNEFLNNVKKSKMTYESD